MRTQHYINWQPKHLMWQNLLAFQINGRQFAIFVPNLSFALINSFSSKFFRYQNVCEQTVSTTNVYKRYGLFADEQRAGQSSWLVLDSCLKKFKSNIPVFPDTNDPGCDSNILPNKLARISPFSPILWPVVAVVPQLSILCLKDVFIDDNIVDNSLGVISSGTISPFIYRPQ